MSRTEMLTELLDYAPREIIGPMRRASTRGGSLEDDDKIDTFIERCRNDP